MSELKRTLITIHRNLALPAADEETPEALQPRLERALALDGSLLLARYNVAGRLLLGAEVDPSRPTLLLPPALAWMPIKRTLAPQPANFSAVQWMRDAKADTPGKAAAHLERRFLRVPFSDAKREEVVQFLESRQWKPEGDPAANERLLRRALHLMLCTPEYQMH